MELKLGYRQTEVGMIPDDWDIKSIRDLADKIMVGIASAATHAYRARGVVLFRNQNIKSGYLDDEDILHIDPVYETTYRGKRLKSGDLLTARTGYPGTTCVVPPMYESAQSFTTLITRPKTKVVDSYYLCHYINSERGQAFFEQSKIGGGQKNVNAGTFQNMPIPVPSKSEQRAIATVLSDVDALVTSLNKIIAKKRAIKQAAMQQLLTGKTRLPGFSGEWEVKKLGEIAEIDSDNLGSNTDPEYAFKYISLEDVDTGTLKGYSEVIFDSAPSRARRKVKKYSILISTVRPNLKSHLLIRDDVSDLVCSTGFSVLQCYPQVADPAYVYSHLFSDGIARQIDSLLTGSNYPALNVNEVRALQIPIPPLPEQVAIAGILSDMDAEIAALERLCDKTRALKQGMMQELLTGRTRLI